MKNIQIAVIKEIKEAHTKIYVAQTPLEKKMLELEKYQTRQEEINKPISDDATEVSTDMDEWSLSDSGSNFKL